MTHRLLALRDPIAKLINRFEVPEPLTIRIAQPDLRREMQADDLTVEAFLMDAVTISPNETNVPGGVVEFVEDQMPELKAELIELFRPLGPFKGLRLWVKRDADGFVRIDGSEAY